MPHEKYMNSQIICAHLPHDKCLFFAGSIDCHPSCTFLDGTAQDDVLADDHVVCSKFENFVEFWNNLGKSGKSTGCLSLY